MKVHRLGTPGQEFQDFSWDAILRIHPRPWYRRFLVPSILALLLPFLSGSSQTHALPFGMDLTDAELWEQRILFVEKALHRAPTQETIGTFRRLWKLGLQQKKETGEGLFFSLIYLDACWRKEGYLDQAYTRQLPITRFPKAHNFSQFLTKTFD